LRRKKEWLLLPAEILTSARRFETEGLRKRQFLNAVIMASGAAGREDFLTRIPDLYRSDRQGSQEPGTYIGEVFIRITTMIDELPDNERSEFWQDIGKYMGANAWQLALFLDEMNRFFRAERSSENRFLANYERYLEKIFCSNLSSQLAATACRTCSFAYSRLIRCQKR
jgi:hypothetical protein